MFSARAVGSFAVRVNSDLEVVGSSRVWLFFSEKQGIVVHTDLYGWYL